MKEKINFKATGEMVFLEIPKIKETTEAGIIKSESQLAEERSKVNDDVWHTIYSVGDKVTTCKAGDKVLIRSGGHSMVDIGDDRQYAYMNEMMIIAVKLD